MNEWMKNEMIVMFLDYRSHPFTIKLFFLQVQNNEAAEQSETDYLVQFADGPCCQKSCTWRIHVTRWPNTAVVRAQTGQTRAQGNRTRRRGVPPRRRRWRDQKFRGRAVAEFFRILGLGKFALAGGLPLDGFRGEMRRFRALRPAQSRGRWWRVAVLAFGGEFVDDGDVDVAGAALAVHAFAAAGVGAFALARENHPELVTEVVLEVNQAGVRVDVFRSWTGFGDENWSSRFRGLGKCVRKFGKMDSISGILTFDWSRVKEH